MNTRLLKEQLGVYGARVVEGSMDDQYFIYLTDWTMSSLNPTQRSERLTLLEANLLRHYPTFEILGKAVGPTDQSYDKRWRLGQSEVLFCVFDTMLRPGDELTPGTDFNLWVNQGVRPATVLARIGCEALIEYTMPKGTSAMLVLTQDKIRASIIKSKHITYRNFPKRWAAAMKEAGTRWVGVKQGNGHRSGLPQPYDTSGDVAEKSE